jgi:hypothetical protein
MEKKGDGALSTSNKGLYYFQIQVNGKRKTIPLKTESKPKAHARSRGETPALFKHEHRPSGRLRRRRQEDDRAKHRAAHVWEKYLANPSRPTRGKRTLEGYDTQWKTVQTNG